MSEYMRQTIYDDGRFRILELTHSSYEGTIEIWEMVEKDGWHFEFKGSFGSRIYGFLSTSIRESLKNNEFPDWLVGFITLSTM